MGATSPACGGRGPDRAAGRSASQPSPAGTTRWTATSAGNGRSAPRRDRRGEGERAEDPVQAVRASYDRGVTDEFIEPVVLEGRPRLTRADATAIFFNFRPDRAASSHRSSGGRLRPDDD
jgi:hypothetical protein